MSRGARVAKDTIVTIGDVSAIVSAATWRFRDSDCTLTSMTRRLAAVLLAAVVLAAVAPATAKGSRDFHVYGAGTQISGGCAMTLTVHASTETSDDAFEWLAVHSTCVGRQLLVRADDIDCTRRYGDKVVIVGSGHRVIVRGGTGEFAVSSGATCALRGRTALSGHGHFEVAG